MKLFKIHSNKLSFMILLLLIFLLGPAKSALASDSTQTYGIGVCSADNQPIFNNSTCVGLYSDFKSPINALAYGDGELFAASGDSIYVCKYNSENHTASCTPTYNFGSQVQSLLYVNGVLYSGLVDGQINYIPISVPNNIGIFTLVDNGANHTVWSLAYGNGSLYAGLSSGILLRCSPDTPNRCEHLDNAGKNHAIRAVLYANNSIYAGADNILWQCSPDAANSCATLDTLNKNSNIDSLLYANSYVYVGMANPDAILLQCSPYDENSCDNFDSPAEYTDVNSLVASDGTIFAALGNGILWSCNDENANECSSLLTSNEGIQSLTQYNNLIFFGTGDLTPDPNNEGVNPYGGVTIVSN